MTDNREPQASLEKKAQEKVEGIMSSVGSHFDDCPPECSCMKAIAAALVAFAEEAVKESGLEADVHWQATLKQARAEGRREGLAEGYSRGLLRAAGVLDEHQKWGAPCCDCPREYAIKIRSLANAESLAEEKYSAEPREERT
jgi:hypothetical protein